MKSWELETAPIQLSFVPSFQCTAMKGPAACLPKFDLYQVASLHLPILVSRTTRASPFHNTELRSRLEPLGVPKIHFEKEDGKEDGVRLRPSINVTRMTTYTSPCYLDR